MAQGYTGGNVTPPSFGQVVQVVNTQDGAVATGTTLIPNDDTIPQNTEGDQYMSLTVTPNNASNKLKIEVVVNGSFGAENRFNAALFQDSTAGAIAAGVGSGVLDNGMLCVFTHYMTAGTTSATTFKVRAGGGGAGTFTFNGYGGTRRFGGVMASSITITEIKA